MLKKIVTSGLVVCLFLAVLFSAAENSRGIHNSMTGAESIMTSGYVTILVKYLDGYPRSGADVWSYFPHLRFLGTTDSNGIVQKYGLEPGDYWIKANYKGIQFGPNTYLYADVNGYGSATITADYEITSPLIDVLSPQNMSHTSNSSVPLTYTVYDFSPISWTGYSLDGQTNVTITGNTTLTGLSYGYHSLAVYANDTFGNMGVSRILFARSHFVPDDYLTIQEAINNANEGDTIFVKNGTYYEHVIVNKTLTLVGQSKEGTIIDGTENGTVLRIAANNTSICDFTVRNSRTPPTGYNPLTDTGILVFASYSQIVENTSIINNIVTENYAGIFIQESLGNIISGNIIADNHFNVGVDESSYNTFNNNTIANSQVGIWFGSGGSNIYHNNFINNTNQVQLDGAYGNSWDNGYPSGGNYWSDYVGTDLYRGAYQNETGSDGIGDTPYVIDENNRDNYPIKLDSISPDITNILRIPATPNYNEDVVVSATITDSITVVDDALLSYTYDMNWHNVSMDKFNDLFNATIHAQPYGTLVQYKIYANDTSGNWAESSTYSYIVGDFVAPEIAAIEWKPTCPPPFVLSSTPRTNEPILFTTSVTEPINASGVAKVQLLYRVDSGEWWNTTMVYNVTSSLWTTVIPGQLGGTTVEFCIKAHDNAGNTIASSVYTFNVRALPTGDLNGDGVVNYKDATLFRQAYISG